MLLWLFMGSFVAGLGVYSLAVAAVGAGYVVYRNQRVDVEYRILTPDHIRSLMGGGARDKLPVRTLLKVYDADGKILPPPVMTPPSSSNGHTTSASSCSTISCSIALRRRTSRRWGQWGAYASSSTGRFWPGPIWTKVTASWSYST